MARCWNARNCLCGVNVPSTQSELTSQKWESEHSISPHALELCLSDDTSDAVHDAVPIFVIPTDNMEANLTMYNATKWATAVVFIGKAGDKVLMVVDRNGLEWLSYSSYISASLEMRRLILPTLLHLDF